MKVLSLPQPYASLITTGILDFLNTTWKPEVVPLRILVFANNKKISEDRLIEDETIEWYQEFCNQIYFGNLPDSSEMPLGAIIGYAAVDRIEQLSDETGNNFEWNFKDAHLFDEPITGVKDNPRLWDYELDENNLPPAHKVVLNEVKLDGKDLYIPLSNYFWNRIDELDGRMVFEYTEEFQEISNKIGHAPFCNKKYRIHFINNGQKRSFHLTEDSDIELGWYVSCECNDDGSPCIYNSLFSGEREYITFNWDYEIK